MHPLLQKIQNARQSLVSFIEKELNKTPSNIKLIGSHDVGDDFQERYIWYVDLNEALECFDSTDTRYVMKTRRKWALEKEVEGALAFTALSAPDQGYRIVCPGWDYFVCQYIDGISAQLFDDKLVDLLKPKGELDEQILMKFMGLYGTAGAKSLFTKQIEYGKDDILVLDEGTPSYIVSVDFTSSFPDPPWDLNKSLSDIKSLIERKKRRANIWDIDKTIFDKSTHIYYQSLLQTFKGIQAMYAQKPDFFINLFEQQNNPYLECVTPKGWQEALRFMDSKKTNIEDAFMANDIPLNH